MNIYWNISYFIITKIFSPWNDLIGSQCGGEEDLEF